MTKTFRDFLMSKHAEGYHGVDDDMPDDFLEWLYNEFGYMELIELADEYVAIQKQEIVEEIEPILRDIIKGEGEFSRDQLTHAENTIEGMKELAKKAIEIITLNKP